MREAAELSSGKGHRDENFPVASFLIAPRHRGTILAFYRFARVADDVADNVEVSAAEKLELLDLMRRTLLGETNAAPEAAALRTMLAERNLTPQHGLDLLEAFCRDVTKLRYRDWDDLLDYCRVSAMPVGRFVLDVHGESRSLWPASDALCSALQIVNHLQDCAKDYRLLNRIYIPVAGFAAAGIEPESLAEPRASAALRLLIIDLAKRTFELLVKSRPFPADIRDSRLALEISFIQLLAESLCRRLMRCDPLSERVHHRKSEVMLLLFPALIAFTRGRFSRRNHHIVTADERPSDTETRAAGVGFDPQTAQVRASGSSFYAGMRILPKAERQAVFAIYAFSKAVDDIADEGSYGPAERHAALDHWRRDIESIYAGSASMRAAFLVPPVQRYGLRREDFLAVIDGMDMDVAENICAPDLGKLDLYCERVASAVGRLCIKAFGMDDGPGFKLAHHLGRALQLTNILRDLDEDAALGRLYLPNEFLRESGIGDRNPFIVIADPAVDKACRRLAILAHEHYAEAETILLGRPAGLLSAPNLMRAVYSEILAKMEQAGWAPPRRRVRLRRSRLLLTLLWHRFAA